MESEILEILNGAYKFFPYMLESTYPVGQYILPTLSPDYDDFQNPCYTK